MNRAIDLRPSNYLAHYNRGLAYHGKGNPDQAIQEYTEAIRLYSGYGPAYRSRGNAYMNKREYPRAVAEFDQALKINPSDADALISRGYARIELKSL